MGWQDLLQEEGETITLPWVGGPRLHGPHRTWRLTFKPLEFGWHLFDVEGRQAKPMAKLEWSAWDSFTPYEVVVGCLVGNRLVAEGIRVDPDPAQIVKASERVYLLPEGLDRFVQVHAGRVYEGGPLIFYEEAFPLGPEPELLEALLDGVDTVKGISGVSSGLDAAFRMEVFQRKEAERRRVEAEARRAQEIARRAEEERRGRLRKQLGDGAIRRELAKVDFEAAARAALKVAGADYLDHRKLARRDEYAVKYRVDGQRLECICDDRLHVIDAGVCLEDHGTGVKGDTLFTLESLPAVIREAERLGVLVIWRHV